MQRVPLLSVSPADQDHAALRELLDGSQWLLSESRTLQSAIGSLRQRQIPLAICECDLQSGTWKDLLERLRDLPNPPSLIVASRYADDQLWVEALTAGAYDLLLKPFNARELNRTLFQAWCRRQPQPEGFSPRKHRLAAAG